MIDEIYRAEFGRALATVARIVGDIGLAEDAVQDAFADALRTWPARGRPDNPGAWITTAARNRALDRLRRDAARDRREAEWIRPMSDDEVSPVPDDQLGMILLCCHPALSPDSRVALTLRLVCGLRTAEIARAFMQSEATVAQRLSRAKTKIRLAAIPLRMRPPEVLPDRVPDILACIYLAFAEGYFATAGEWAVRADLCAEAIRLGRLVCELLPDETEAHALLALMLLDDSRRAQRVGVDGDLIPLDEQDRDAWDRDLIAEGMAHLREAARGRGPFLAQAAIAAAHATAPTWHATDWAVVVAAYDDLLGYSPSPAAQLNRAVAVGFRDGFAAGLAALDQIVDDPRIASGHTIAAARADLLRRSGRNADAAKAYEVAVARAANAQTRRFLQRRLDQVREA